MYMCMCVCVCVCVVCVCVCVYNNKFARAILNRYVSNENSLLCIYIKNNNKLSRVI